MAFTVRVNGFDVRCDTVAEMAAVMREMGAGEMPSLKTGAAGGIARAASLTPERRSEIGAVAATRGRTFLAELEALAPWAGALSVALRRIYDLRRSGKEPREIAPLVGNTVGAVSTSLSVIRRRLKRARKAHPDPPGAIEPKRGRYRCGKCGEVGHTARRHDVISGLPRAVLEVEQPPPARAEEPPTPSPGRGELLADQRGGPPDEPSAPAPVDPVKHEGSVCENAQVAGSASSEDEEQEVAFPTMVAPGDTAEGDRHLKRRRCKACGELGHNRRRCPTLGKTPAAPTEVDVLEAPIGVRPGDVFVVVEDFTEEEIGIVWIAADRWTAIAATGREVEGYAEWRLHNADGLSLPGHPQLHPFIRVV
jgi:hypothetical protein